MARRDSSSFDSIALRGTLPPDSSLPVPTFSLHWFSFLCSCCRLVVEDLAAAEEGVAGPLSWKGSVPGWAIGLIGRSLWT